MTPLDRLGTWFARRGWAHLTLLCGVGIFLFPFLWMVGLSMKTDDEASSTQLLPTIPTFCGSSPVIRPAEVPQRPQSVAKASWDALLPGMINQTRAKIESLSLPAGGNAVNAATLREAASQTLAAEMVEKLSESAWVGDQKAFLAAYSPLLTQQALSNAMDQQIGRLELIGLQVQGLDGRIFNIDSGAVIAQKWKVESGPAQLLSDGRDLSYLRYHFLSSSDQPIVLRADFDARIPADQLHKLIFSFQGDDSWQRIDATLDLGNRHWKSASTTYIAQYRATSIIFQPHGFDDMSYRPKTWVSLLDASPSCDNLAQTQACLRIVIKPSSSALAIWGKVERNYLRAFRAIPFWTYVGNSVLLVVLQMTGALFSSAFVAYAFARLSWPGRSLAFGILLGTMMLPSQVTMIPSFIIWRSLGWFNTLNPLWVPAWCGSGFFIFLMTQNMKTIPRELEEAAKIDGLNSVQTWWYVIVPLVKPTLAAIAIMVFMGAWNDFMGPLIMLRDQSRFPLSLGLFGLHIDNKLDATLIMAGNMLMTLPVILVFFIFQRYFIEGVSVSGMKG